MTNQEVFTAFAARAHAKGGSVRSERTANGVVLYSYATPIAVFEDGTTEPVFTERRFSVTTSKQQAQAKRTCGTWTEYEDKPFRNYAKTVGASFALAR